MNALVCVLRWHDFIAVERKSKKCTFQRLEMRARHTWPTGQLKWSAAVFKVTTNRAFNVHYK